MKHTGPRNLILTSCVALALAAATVTAQNKEAKPPTSCEHDNAIELVRQQNSPPPPKRGKSETKPPKP